jgi:hypothetical protein
VKLSFGPVLAAALALGGCGASSGDAESTDEGAASALGADAWRAYGDLARAGGLDPDAADSARASVIGLRGGAHDGASHATTYVLAFDDTFAVMTSDHRVLRFRGSTHPFQNTAPGVPDVDGDGVPDVGMIRPGVYDAGARDRLVAGQPSWAVTQNGSGKLPGWRDTDHDGVLDDGERAASERRGDTLTDVLFHQGEGGAPPAVGCQVLPASAMRAFTAAVGGGRASFRYVLVDMTGRAPMP